MHLEHTRLLVTRFGECFKFYRDIMGFAITWGDEDSGYASFHDGHGARVSLALFSRQSMADTVGLTKFPTDAFCQDRFMLIVQVEDVDATVERLSQRGIQFEVGPQDYADWGMRGAYLRDPDGNLIELSGSLDRGKWSEGLREADRKYATS